MTESRQVVRKAKRMAVKATARTLSPLPVTPYKPIIPHSKYQRLLLGR